jgi:hypothetical protein
LDVGTKFDVRAVTAKARAVAEAAVMANPNAVTAGSEEVMDAAASDGAGDATAVTASAEVKATTGEADVATGSAALQWYIPRLSLEEGARLEQEAATAAAAASAAEESRDAFFESMRGAVMAKRAAVAIARPPPPKPLAETQAADAQPPDSACGHDD